MSEQQTESTTAVKEQPAPGSYASWSSYWAAQGMPWRTEPEIDAERQAYLAERRATKPDIERGIYPFKDVKLNRADVEWLLATHESGGMRGPVDWNDTRQQGRDGLDLRGVDLRAADLSGLPLACLQAGLRLSEVPIGIAARPEIEAVPGYSDTVGLSASLAHLERANLSGARLQNACLRMAQCQEINLREAHLEAAMLLHANLEAADLVRAHLEGAVLTGANCNRAQLIEAHCEGANLLWARFDDSILQEAHLDDADLRRVTFSATTVLNGAWLGSERDGLTRVCDVVWSGANVTFIRWVQARRHQHGDQQMGAQAGVGSELQAMEALLQGNIPQGTAAANLLADRRALRAHRQVALLMREQGLNDEADRFAYRAQVLQRRVQRRQGRLGRALGSWLLDAVAGYGYKPVRSVIAYLLVIAVFAAAFFGLGMVSAHPLNWNEAIVVSLTAFHGRGFFATAFLPGDPQAAIAAIEAVIGLLIEITFIATFTQRFFGAR